LYPHLPQARSWLQTMGYFLCFGIILAKMWRVYYIFHNPSPKKKRNVSLEIIDILLSIIQSLQSSLLQ
jgi:gamma-aminobutyric acid type B receptor